MGDWLRARVRRWLGLELLSLEVTAALVRLALTEEIVKRLTRVADRQVSDARRVPVGRTHQKPKGRPD